MELQHTLVFIANVAFRLKLRRIQLRMTKLDVYIKFGMKISALSRIETGHHFFTVKTIIPLMEFYCLTESELFANCTEKPSFRDIRHLDLLDDELQRFRKSKGYRKLKMAKQLKLW